MDEKTHQQRRALLAEMERIEHMEFGALAEEYRESETGGKTVRNGPYFKHQQWSKGRNISRRIPIEEAADLREAIEGRQRFEELARGFIELTVAATRGEQSSESKKNSAKKSGGPKARKPKTSSPP